MVARKGPLAFGIYATVCFALTTCLAETAAIPSLEPAKPLHIGVGGDYPAGADGLLISRGLPHERVFPWELADPEFLKRHQVLLLSCPSATEGSLDDALIEWVEAGGRAYVEVWAAQQGRWPLAAYVTSRGLVPENTDLLAVGAEHPITAALNAKAPVDLFHLRGHYLQATRPESAEVLARYCADGGGSILQTGAAVLRLAIGRGEIVYSGAPLTFCHFHRGPTTEPLMARILSHLCEGRDQARLTRVEAEAPEASSEASVVEDENAARVPEGFEAIDHAWEGPYNVSALLSASGGGVGASALALDGRFNAAGVAVRPCLWLVLTPSQVELRVGFDPGGALRSRVLRPLPGEPTELLIQRRPGTVSVMLGDEEILKARTGVKPGGTVAFSARSVSLDEPACQLLADPVFEDGFMYEPGEAGAWSTISGKWRTVGIGHEEHSVNGFYLRGQQDGADAALGVAGAPWWEEYTCSVAARPDKEVAVGVCALQRGEGDYVAFVAASADTPGATFRLARSRGGVHSTLAQTLGGLSPQQWHRLALRVYAGTLEGIVDGQTVVSCDHAEARGGAIGLLVRGGAARFDDVLVQPSSEPLRAPGDEGTPSPRAPAALGPQDQLTWANPAVRWSAAARRPSLLWHTGGFASEAALAVRIEPVAEPAARRMALAPSTESPEEDWVSVTASLLPGANTLDLVFVCPGRPPVQRGVPLGAGGTLSLLRRGDVVDAQWGDATIFRMARGGSALRRLGLEVSGPPLPVGAVEVRAPGVRDYVFGAAPTDWWVSSGTWEVASRWACDSRWSWFAGWGEQDFAVWNKWPVEGDVTLEFHVGIKMTAPGGPETQRCRDLNSVLCGDRSDPRSGYSFIIGGDGGAKTQLLRSGVVVAENPAIRVPAGYGIHHEWFHVRVSKVGGRIEMDFEGRPAIRFEDPRPLTGGYVGLWSRNSGILIPRVTVYR